MSEIRCRHLLTSLLICAVALTNQIASPQSTTQQTSPQSSDNLSVGVNLDFVRDYSSEVPFVDLFRAARPWISQRVGAEWGEGPALDINPDGWIRRLDPGQYASTLLCSENGIPPGKYTCLYDGTGRLEFEGNARVVEAGPGRITLAVQPPGDIIVHLRETDSDDPLRNIRVIMPGRLKTYVNEPFNPEFMKNKSVYGVLRFKDWQLTDDCTKRTWSDQTPMTAGSQANGVAIGWMVRLSNELKADPWFAMPHLADDDFVRRFAEEVKNTLEPDRKVYVEYTNEAWNTIFAQNAWVREQGKKLSLPGDDFQAGLHFYSKRAVEVFHIWSQVFEGSDRLVRVMGGQADNPWVSEQMLKYQDAWKVTDALAIGPYFGHEFGTPENANRVDSLNVSDVLRYCADDLPRLKGDIEANVRIAAQYQLPLIAYEGGQHLWALHEAVENEKFTDLLIAANRDPRMKLLYLKHLADWKAAGGQLYVHYKSVGAPGKYGSWGLQEYEGQKLSDAPKLQALLEFFRVNPQWWE